MQLEGEVHKNITAGNVQIILWETNATQHVFENTFAYVALRFSLGVRFGSVAGLALRFSLGVRFGSVAGLGLRWAKLVVAVGQCGWGAWVDGRGSMDVYVLELVIPQSRVCIDV